MAILSSAQLESNLSETLENPGRMPPKPVQPAEIDAPPDSGVSASGDRFALAWQQLIADETNADKLYPDIRESCCRETWIALGYGSFGAYCEERLGKDEAYVSALLKRRFGTHRYRLLTVRPSRQGVRTDLEPTSSSHCVKSGPRMDGLVRATLVAIDRAPALAQLVEQGMLPWELGAKLGKNELSIEQVDQVKAFGADVARLVSLPAKDAKREIRAAVEVIVGKPKTAAVRLADELRRLEPAELFDVLCALPMDVLRSVLSGGANAVVLPDPPPVSDDPSKTISGEVPDPAGGHRGLVALADPSAKLPPPVVIDDGQGPAVAKGATEATAGHPQPGAAADGSGATPLTIIVEGGNLGCGRHPIGAPEGEGVDVGELDVNHSTDFPDWAWFDGAVEVVVDVEISGLGDDVPTKIRTLATREGAPPPTLNAVMGVQLSTFQSKTVNRKTKDLESLAAKYHLKPFNELEGAPSAATVVVCFADDAGTTRFIGIERITPSGQLPDELVVATKDDYGKRLFVRGSRTSSLFGTVSAVFVHEPSAAREVAVAAE